MSNESYFYLSNKSNTYFSLLSRDIIPHINEFIPTYRNIIYDFKMYVKYNLNKSVLHFDDFYNFAMHILKNDCKFEYDCTHISEFLLYFEKECMPRLFNRNSDSNKIFNLYMECIGYDELIEIINKNFMQHVNISKIEFDFTCDYNIEFISYYIRHNHGILSEIVYVLSEMIKHEYYHGGVYYLNYLLYELKDSYHELKFTLHELYQETLSILLKNDNNNENLKDFIVILMCEVDKNFQINNENIFRMKYLDVFDHINNIYDNKLEYTK